MTDHAQKWLWPRRYIPRLRRPPVTGKAPAPIAGHDFELARGEPAEDLVSSNIDDVQVTVWGDG